MTLKECLHNCTNKKGTYNTFDRLCLGFRSNDGRFLIIIAIATNSRVGLRHGRVIHLWHFFSGRAKKRKRTKQASTTTKIWIGICVVVEEPGDNNFLCELGPVGCADIAHF